MERSTRGLGFRLITVSVALVAAAALVVGAVVTKLSEDEVQTRLRTQVEELANQVSGAVEAGGDPQELGRMLLAAKLRKTGTAWVLGRDGQFVTPPDPRLTTYIDKCVPFGASEIELTKVWQSTLAPRARDTTHKIPLAAVVGRYDAGVGILDCLGEPHVTAFQVLPESGWIVGVDEPYAATYSSTASLKKYVLITCVTLGFSILLSTVISISFIIKPFYRERLEMTARIEAANRNLKRLHDVSVGMQKSLALGDRIHKILLAAREVLGLDRILIFLPNTDNTVLECRGAVGNEDEPPESIALPIGPEGGCISQAYLKRKTFRILNSLELPKELRLRPPYSEIKAVRSRSFVVLPMIVENQCVGVVAVDNQVSKKLITDDVIEGLELFTSQAAVAIENAKLYQQLKLYADELEVTDHLTQLFTFFHFKKLLQGEIDRVRVTGGELSLAVFSIENFARYNEMLGHKHGDEVLRAVAGEIRHGVRKRDVLGRCFGSTFAVIFPGTTREDAAAIVKDVVAKLIDRSYLGEDALPEKGIRFLSGVSEYRRGEGWSAEDFFTAVNERSKSTVT
jgi:diguanylate cyclase (GGDEF)-like protein